MFGFDSLSLSNSVGETGLVSLTVQRLQGDHGSVTVHWEIRDLSTGTVATSDFETASGTLEFLDGDREETLVLRPTDEIEPELDEQFAVFLTDAVSNDGFTSFNSHQWCQHRLITRAFQSHCYRERLSLWPASILHHPPPLHLVSFQLPAPCLRCQ